MNVGKLESSEELIMNSYTFSLNKMLDDVDLKDLIELISNCTLEMQLECKTLEEYWCSAMASFHGLCEMALVELIPFETM